MNSSKILAKKAALSEKASTAKPPAWRDGSKPYMTIAVSLSITLLLWMLAVGHSWSLAASSGTSQPGPVGEAQLAHHHYPFPAPPEPFRYAGFMAWLRREHLDGRDFDVDRAMMTGPLADFLQGEGGAVAAAVAKSINRWSFQPDAWKTKLPPPMASLHVQLYVLRRLLSASEVPEATFLDVGCGTGYLLAAWRLAAANGGRALGLDVDPEAVAEASKRLQQPEAYDAASELAGVPPAEVYVGDIFAPQAAANLQMAPASVHAINVGVAVQGLDDLTELAQLLRPEGLLAAPICRDAPVIHEGRSQCTAMLRVFKKKAKDARGGHELQGLPDDSTAHGGEIGVPIEAVTLAWRGARKHEEPPSAAHH